MSTNPNLEVLQWIWVTEQQQSHTEKSSVILHDVYLAKMVTSGTSL